MLVIVATFRRLVRPILVSLESHNCLLCLRCLASPSLLRPLLQRPGLNTLSLPQWLCSLSGRSSVRRYASDRLSRVQFGLDRGFCRASFCQPATSFLGPIASLCYDVCSSTFVSIPYSNSSRWLPMTVAMGAWPCLFPRFGE